MFTIFLRMIWKENAFLQFVPQYSLVKGDFFQQFQYKSTIDADLNNKDLFS